MGRFYILDADHVPVAVDISIWGAWFEKSDDARVVAQDNIGDIFVSTVFLGIDHN